MKTLVFSYPNENCPECHSHLKAYRLNRRTVKTGNGTYTAEHRIMICPVEGTRYRSMELDLMIPPKCTYANDIMVESAMERFINGKSSSEMPSLFGLSESHARKLNVN